MNIHVKSTLLRFERSETRRSPANRSLFNTRVPTYMYKYVKYLDRAGRLHTHPPSYPYGENLCTYYVDVKARIS